MHQIVILPDSLYNILICIKNAANSRAYLKCFSDGKNVSGEHKIVLRNSTIIFEKRKMNSIHVCPWVRVQEFKENLFLTNALLK